MGFRLPDTTSSSFPKFMLWLSFALTVVAANHGLAQEIVVVDITDDIVDFGGQQRVDNLPGPDGKISFREAVIAANQTPGPQSIHFAIPMEEWFLLNDMALLQQGFNTFVVTGDETTIDFSTQTLFTGDTNPVGREVGIFGLHPNSLGVPAIIIAADNCLVVGMGDVLQRGYALSIAGNNNRVEGCIIRGPIHDSIEIEGGFPGPPASGNVIGGLLPEQQNRLESLRIAAPANDNVVIGNIFDGDGVKIQAVMELNLFAVNNRIGGPSEAERNLFFGAGSYSSEGTPTGENILVFDAENTVIENNRIGLLEDGVTPSGQVAPTGIQIRGSLNTLIRNNTVVAMQTIGINHVAGQLFGEGIVIHGPSVTTTLENNRIGVDPAGNAIPNLNGISIGTLQGAPVDTLIGGSPEAANIVAHSEIIGIEVQSAVSSVSIRANRIFNNGALGIDLNGDGVTPNDAMDTDSGANALQNFPVIEMATSDVRSTMVEATLSSTPNSEFILEFFSNPANNSFNHGAGETLIGIVPVSTDSSGNATLSTSFPVATPEGYFVSSTATNLSTQNTSEFSQNVEIVISSILPGDINQDGVVSLLDVAPFVSLITTETYQAEGDMNGDGVVDLLDVAPFVHSLIGN